MENEPIILKSKLKKCTYTMHDDAIVVHFDDMTYNIELPKEGKNLSFYDMYYINDKLTVIIATSSSYDVRYELDEDNLKLQKIAYSK